MNSICGLLVISSVEGLLHPKVLDDHTWQSLDKWVVCCASKEAKESLSALKIDSIVSILVEPDRPARFRAGLDAAKQVADYALLFQPGMKILEFELPSLLNKPPAVRLQYIGRKNMVRWRRTMVSTSRDWIYNELAGEWQSLEDPTADIIDTSSSLLESPLETASQLEWSKQLHAQLELYPEHPDSEHLIYEIALSYLRLADDQSAYQWFEKLSGEVSENPVHKAVALTMMSQLNQTERSAEERISLCRKAIEYWPNFADCHFQLAELLFEQGKISESIDAASAWQDAVKDDFSALDGTVMNTRIPRLLAECYAQLGRYNRAITYYNRALHVNNKYYVASSEKDSLANMHKARDEIYLRAYPLPSVNVEQQNRIKIIVAFWNAAEYLPDCVASIAQQRYQNYEVVFIDDSSTDGGLDGVDLSSLADFQIVKTASRRGPLRNQVEAVIEHCDADDIVVVLDGDDQLSDPEVLSHLNDVYAATDCWVTLGQFRVSEDWQWGYARPILANEDITEIFANQTLRFPVHLRTHRAGLIHRQNEQDLQLSAYRGNNHQFYFYASDVAYCRVIMSLAGAEKIRYIPRVLMDYNVGNPLSVHQKHRPEQTQSCIDIAKMAAIAPISDYRA